MIAGTRHNAASTPSKGVLKCPDGSRPRILLAEDSSAARILTTALLTRMGCDVDDAEHGEDALAHAQSRSYDVILMDIEMPVMDGVTAAQEIRALGGAAGRTPIIALSAFLADSRDASIWRDSFDINLAKPAGREQLRQVIQVVIDVSHGIDPDNASLTTPAANNNGLIDDEALLRLRGDMTESASHRLLAVVITEIEDCVKLLSSAHEDNNPQAAAKAAHKLKGIASTFAAPKLEQLARSLENDAAGGQTVPPVAEICTCAGQTTSALNAARVA